MKNSKIILIFLIGTFCFYAPKVLAAVQPMPDESAPNISGNIDWPNSLQNQNVGTSGAGAADISNPQNPTENNGTQSGGTPGNNLINPNSAENNTGSPNQNDGNGTNPSSYTANNGTPNSGAPTSNTPSNNASDQQNFASFDAFPSQTSDQTPSVSKQNDGDSDDSAVSQNNAQPQEATPQTSYAWPIIFGSTIIFVIAFMLWKLKKNP